MGEKGHFFPLYTIPKDPFVCPKLPGFSSSNPIAGFDMFRPSVFYLVRGGRRILRGSNLISKKTMKTWK